MKKKKFCVTRGSVILVTQGGTRSQKIDPKDNGESLYWRALAKEQ